MKMPAAVKIRMAFIGALWLLLCYIVAASQPMSARVVFVIVASGIIVWVPLYKKYVKKQ